MLCVCFVAIRVTVGNRGVLMSHSEGIHNLKIRGKKHIVLGDSTKNFYSRCDSFLHISIMKYNLLFGKGTS